MYVCEGIWKWGKIEENSVLPKMEKILSSIITVSTQLRSSSNSSQPFPWRRYCAQTPQTSSMDGLKSTVETYLLGVETHAWVRLSWTLFPWRRFVYCWYPTTSFYQGVWIRIERIWGYPRWVRVWCARCRLSRRVSPWFPVGRWRSAPMLRVVAFHSLSLLLLSSSCSPSSSRRLMKIVC